VSAFVNLPISRKLIAAFAAVIAVIFVSSAVVYDRLLIIEEARSWRARSVEVLETLATAMDAMVDQETGARGYLITGHEISLEPYHRASNAFPVAMRKLKDLFSDNPAQQSRLDDLNELANKWRSDIAEREIALMAKPETREDARALETSMAGKTAMDLVRAKVDEIASAERDLLAKRGVVQQQAFATAYMMTIVAGAASLIVAILMGVLLSRSITVPITRMTSAMTELAKGHTAVEVPEARRRDEIGAMAAAVQVFKDSMIERHRAQEELARANRLATMGQLTASIAHEVSQPISGAVMSGHAALRWLTNEPPDLEAARRAIERMTNDATRAGDVIVRIRNLVKKAPPRWDPLDINEASRDVIALTRSEVLRHGVMLQTQLARDLPFVKGDRVQLQQVMLNLILNAVEAMSDLDAPRELLIRTRAGCLKERARHCAGFGPGAGPKTCGPPVRRLLHDQARRHGPRPGHLSFDHWRPRRADMGVAERTWRCRVSVHAPFRTGRDRSG
jgi:CHASE3 domain sensor protein